ncbi:VOC family protein [Paenibacillus chitinolyticus]|uniref:VOC family protein n=1 Tax=Paenibacillus chitinolyticus TaxID=79263 RepID=UPI002DBFC4D1|nr:VOC family protein [Paenibacillus chitinolyticus]MEC0248434.1 VOC family protein [Paenibacillus chitinolyticus]
MPQAFLSGIDHVQLPVTDLEESIHWYGKIFGFQVIGHYGESAMLSVHKGPNLMLWQTKNYSPVRFNKDGELKPVLFFSSGDIDNLVKHLKEKSVAIASFDDGGFAKFLKFYDLNGNLIGVMQLAGKR